MFWIIYDQRSKTSYPYRLVNSSVVKLDKIQINEILK